MRSQPGDPEFGGVSGLASLANTARLRSGVTRAQARAAVRRLWDVAILIPRAAHDVRVDHLRWRALVGVAKLHGDRIHRFLIGIDGEVSPEPFSPVGMIEELRGDLGLEVSPLVWPFEHPDEPCPERVTRRGKIPRWSRYRNEVAVAAG